MLLAISVSVQSFSQLLIYDLLSNMLFYMEKMSPNKHKSDLINSDSKNKTEQCGTLLFPGYFAIDLKMPFVSEESPKDGSRERPLSLQSSCLSLEACIEMKASYPTTCFNWLP